MNKFQKVVLLTLLVFVVLGSLLIIAFLPAWVTAALINKRVEFPHLYDPALFGLNPRELTLKTQDGLDLAAWEVPVEEPKGVLIFLSALGGPSVTIFWGHARFFQEHGYASLLLEMRAHGDSAGEQIGLGYLEHLDVWAALEYLQTKERYAKAPLIPYGLAMGGAVAINAVGLYPQLGGLISIAAYSSWADLFADNLYFSGAPLLLALLEKPFVKLYTLFKFGWSRREITPQNQIARLGSRPALLLHSQKDEQISFLNLERLLLSAPPQVEVFLRPGAQHFVCSNLAEPEQDQEYLQRVLQFLENNF